MCQRRVHVQPVHVRRLLHQPYGGTCELFGQQGVGSCGASGQTCGQCQAGAACEQISTGGFCGCAVGTAPACNGNDFVTCSASGTLNTQVCGALTCDDTLGCVECQPGATCDIAAVAGGPGSTVGACAGGGTCNSGGTCFPPTNPVTQSPLPIGQFSGPLDFSNAPAANGSFDWNCDGMLEQPTVASDCTDFSCVLNATQDGCDMNPALPADCNGSPNITIPAACGQPTENSFMTCSFIPASPSAPAECLPSSSIALGPNQACE